MRRVQLGVESRGGRRELNLKALFDAFDLAWEDEQDSREVLQRALEHLEKKEGTPSQG